MEELEPFIYQYYDVILKGHFPSFDLFFPEQGQATEKRLYLISDPAYDEIRISDTFAIEYAFSLWNRHFENLLRFESRVPQEFWFILPKHIKAEIKAILAGYNIELDRLIIIIALANHFLSLRSTRRLHDSDEESRDFNQQLATLKNLLAKYGNVRNRVFHETEQVQSIKFSFLNKEQTFLIKDYHIIRAIMERIHSAFSPDLSEYKADTTSRKFERGLLRTEFFDLIVSGLYNLIIEEDLFPAKRKEYPKALMDLITQLFSIIFPNYWAEDRGLSENSKVVEVRLRRFLN